MPPPLDRIGDDFFGEVLATLPSPVVGFCRSGARSRQLYEATHPALHRGARAAPG